MFPWDTRSELYAKLQGIQNVKCRQCDNFKTIYASPTLDLNKSLVGESKQALGSLYIK